MLTDDPGSTEPLVVTRDGPVATLWLNRPEKRNAVTKAMWEGIATTCAELAADGTVRVHGRPRHGRSLLRRRRHRGARARRRQLRARERGRRACARLVSEADDRVRARFVCRRRRADRDRVRPSHRRHHGPVRDHARAPGHRVSRVRRRSRGAPVGPVGDEAPALLGRADRHRPSPADRDGGRGARSCRGLRAPRCVRDAPCDRALVAHSGVEQGDGRRVRAHR